MHDPCHWQGFFYPPTGAGYHLEPHYCEKVFPVTMVAAYIKATGTKDAML